MGLLPHTIYTACGSPVFPGDTHMAQSTSCRTWEAGAGRDPQVPTGPLERYPGGGLWPKLVAASLFTSWLCCVTHACDYHACPGPLTAWSGAVCAEGHGGQTERRPVQGTCTFNPIFTHPRYHYGPASVVSGNWGSELRQGACPLPPPTSWQAGLGRESPGASTLLQLWQAWVPPSTPQPSPHGPTSTGLCPHWNLLPTDSHTALLPNAEKQ